MLCDCGISCVSSLSFLLPLSLDAAARERVQNKTIEIIKECILDTLQGSKHNGRTDGHTDGQCENSIPHETQFAGV